MSLVRRPLVIAFDVIETLFPLDPLEQRFTAAGLPEGMMRHWFDRVLRNGFALAASGGYRPFKELAIGALQDLNGHELSHRTVEQLVGAIVELPPRPDAAPAIRHARAAEARVVAVTNGAAATTWAMLERAGVTEEVERVVSVEEVGRWKPAPDVYLHTAEVCGVDPARAALVAAHAWDVHGAQRAGLVTGWSSHLEGWFPGAFDPADVTGSGLVSVVHELLEL